MSKRQDGHGSPDKGRPIVEEVAKAPARTQLVVLTVATSLPG